EGGPGPGAEVEDEPADDLSPGQDREGDAFGGQLDLELTAGVHPVAAVGHDSVALQGRQVEPVGERRGLELTVDELEQVDELGAGQGDDVGGIGTPGDLVGQEPDFLQPTSAP